MAKNEIRMDYLPFAEKLRTEIKRAGLTQAAVATGLGVSLPTVSSYCAGRSKPNEQKLRALEDLLELNDGTLASLLPEDMRQRKKETAPQKRTLTPENGWRAIAPTHNKTTAKPSEVLQSIERTAQPAATKVPKVPERKEPDEALKPGPKPQPERKVPELMNLPWAMPAQVGHMRRVLDQYEFEMNRVYSEKYGSEDKEIRAAKKDFMFYAKKEFIAARQALSDLEFQLRCFLEMPL